MIKISNSAKERLVYLLDKDTEKKQCVRVGVESGGCSGLNYKLDFANSRNDEDELIESIPMYQRFHSLHAYLPSELNPKKNRSSKGIKTVSNCSLATALKALNHPQ